MSSEQSTFTPWLPEYLSYSSVSKYEECPRSWYLNYVRKAEPRQTWYLPMGTAVHESIEQYIKTGDAPEFKDIFYPLIEKQLIIDPDHRNWLSAGSKEHVVQGHECVELGKRCVENAVKFLENMDVHSVEADVSCALPGFERPVKAFVDILGEHKKHGMLIVDWKSGKAKPKETFQLEVYKALIVSQAEKRLGASHFNGYWGLLNPEATPKTDKARFVDLSKVDPEEVGKRFQRAYDGMKAAIYKANKKFGCKFCWQQDNCMANLAPMGSERARYWDKSSEQGVPY